MSDWPVLRRYDRDHLREIAMPVGGIGTGFFCLGGGGQLTDWQLMSRPSRGWRPMYCHFVAWTRKGNGEAQIRILEDEIRERLGTDFGDPMILGGLPRMKAEGFEATYPFGKAILKEPHFPLSVEVEAFNPLIPRHSDESSLPFGLLTVTLTNTTQEHLESSLTYLATNFIGADGHVFELKDNITETCEAGGWRGMKWWKTREEKKAQQGTMALLFDQPDVKVARRWMFRDRAWNGETLGIMDELLEKGYIQDVEAGKPCPPSPQDTWDSSISAMFKLAPGEKKTVRMIVAWHFPYRNLQEEGWWSGPKGSDPALQNHYGMAFKDAEHVASHSIPKLDDLRAKTKKFVETVLKHPAPAKLKEAALFNLAVLNSHTCFRLGDGTFAAFEGCGSGSGCCTGSCTHVWNYEAATAELFPDLQRSMLEAHFGPAMTKEGAQRFRISLPLANQTFNGAAADGQMGMIVRCYQQYTLDKDPEWLKKMWPNIKSALAFAWVPGGWDADQDGVMEGVQHNTYDVEFFGPNAMCTSWYHAALEAGVKMAAVVGDKEFEGKCSALRTKGSAWMDQNLYNGHYYVQKFAKPSGEPAALTSVTGEGKSEHPRFQIGNGCHTDQLIGQYKANRAGLGDLFDRYHMVQSMKSVFKNNYRDNQRDQYNNMRTYATADEACLIVATYPEGGRPEFPFPYWSECWTGMEYAAASLLLDLGLRHEGEMVATAARNRHDGAKRNPFNEPECGSYYARSMSSWSLLHAWAPDAARW